MIPAVRPVATGIIGILGGMGPASSAHFYSEVIRLCQRKYGAHQDSDFPHMILCSLPMSDWGTTGFENVDSVAAQLKLGLERLEKAGADFIAVPCNTVHYLYDTMQANVGVPVMNMVELVVRQAKQRGWKTIGVLGTQSTIRLEVYPTAAKREGVTVLVPTDEETALVTKVIGDVEGGNQTPADTDMLRTLAATLRARGADGVVLGCTELPIVISQRDTDVPLIDTTALLAEATVDRAYGMSGQ